MDNTLVDFKYGISRLSSEDSATYKDAYDDAPGIFGTMIPLDGAIEAFTTLSKVYDTYILSTAPWNNPSAWSDKLGWVQSYFGKDEGHPGLEAVDPVPPQELESRGPHRGRPNP